MASVPVNLFNAGPQGVSIMLNAGAPFTIAATGPNLNWAPQQPTTGPTFSGNNPGPNIFGFGDNQVFVTVGQSAHAQVFTVTVPNSLNITALEVYMWWGTSSTVNWVAMNGGVMFAQGNSVSLAALQGAPKKH